MDNQTTTIPTEPLTLEKMEKVYESATQAEIDSPLPTEPVLIEDLVVDTTPGLTSLTYQGKPVGDDLGHDKLLPTLYFILDAFERAQIDFFLIRQTAHSAMTGHYLSGDHIDIGVRNNEWISDAKDILFAYFEDERVEKTKDEPDVMTFVWRDIPFTIHLYEDNPCLMALNTIAYEYESWHIPNQFARFEEEFDK